LPHYFMLYFCNIWSKELTLLLRYYTGKHTELCI